MKKRILSLLLVAAMLLTLLPQWHIEANAHKIVMTADEFIDCLWTAYNRPNVYRNVFPYNLGYYDGSVIYFDCWNLGKAIIWSKGAIVNNYTVGYHASMDTSCGLGDWDGLTIVKEAPNCSTDFSDLVPGEWLYMDNHTGYYVGNGQVIECTAGWNVWGITVSQIDKYGNRSRNGVGGGKWVYHGMVPWLDYEQETWIEKACFDVMVYRDRNKDLSHMSDEELKKHWKEHGIKEGRPSSTVLDLGFYLNNNPDLKEAFGNDYEKLYNHFITKGYKEYRKSSALFDGRYYTENHPDVASAFKENYLKHYIETGIYEGRRASLTFDPNYYWYIVPDVAKTWPGDYYMCARHYAGHGINAQIEAYDKEAPVVTDAQIYDVSSSGYTVSCKVTDNWGVSKVVFPSWTVMDGQDDLAENFMNTQKGTKNGDTYTFRVNASAHNFEGGQYVTHIYAVDKGGNQTQLVLEQVEVKDPGEDEPVVPEEPVLPDEPALPEEPEEITLRDTAPYTQEEGLLKYVSDGTTVQALLAHFENGALEVQDRKGNPLTAADTVGTGTSLTLYSGDQAVDTLVVVVLGDVDGNGTVDTTDYMRIKASFMGSYAMTEVERCAADVDQNGIMGTTDYMRIKAYFLDDYDLQS